MSRVVGLCFVTALAACAPDLSVRASRITAPRVIAVRADPPEARPGATVTLTATVAIPRGTQGEPTLAWSACEVPRAATESATVSARCLDDASAPLEGELRGLSVTTTIPADACRRVGPQTPPAGQDGVRVRAPDPDITGGWQLPVRIDLGVGGARETLFARYRVRCQPPDVPGATAQGYATRYTNNLNPSIAGVFAVVGGATRALPRDADAPTAIGTSRDVTLLALWDAPASERYVLVDPTTRALVERTEVLEVTWFTDGGSFERDRTAPDASGTATANILHLNPDATGDARVWVVLRDDRGGVDAARLRVRAGE